MSASFDIARVKRGQTAFGPAVTITAAMQAGVLDWVGSEKWAEDQSPTLVASRTKRRCLLRFVKNASGITLKGKRLVRFKDGTMGSQVDGYTHQVGQGAYAVTDEYLPSGGVRDGDYFWVVIRGPSIAKTSTISDAQITIANNSLLIADTAASSQNETNAGRVRVFSVADPTDATVALQNHNNANNALGRAQSAITSGQTDSDILVEVDYHR